MKCRKQSHSMALFSPRVPTSRKVYLGRSRNTFVYWSFLISAAGFEKSLFFWPNACYTLRRSDCPIPCKGTDLQPSSRKVHLKLILSNTPARGQTKMPFSVFAQWRQKRAFFIGKNRCLMFGKKQRRPMQVCIPARAAFLLSPCGEDRSRTVKDGKGRWDHQSTFVPLREEHGKGVSACAHRDLCGGASGSTDTPPMPRAVLIPMPP